MPVYTKHSQQGKDKTVTKEKQLCLEEPDISEAVGSVFCTLCGVFKYSFGPWYEVKGPSVGLERSKGSSV